MRPLISALVLAFATLPALAQPDPHAGHHAPAAAGQAANAEMSEGSIRKIDAAAGKLTIAHGPLTNLGMPPMTMSFKADKTLLAGLKPGDTVRFVAEQKGNDYVVTRLQAKK